MKNLLFLSLLVTFFVTDIYAQKNKGTKSIFPECSVFADFEELGMHKVDFVDLFGYPTFKEMFFNQNEDKVNIYHYVEFLEKKSYLSPYELLKVHTTFIFVNDELIRQNSQLISDGFDLGKLLDDIDYIKDEVSYE